MSYWKSQEKNNEINRIHSDTEKSMPKEKEIECTFSLTSQSSWAIMSS